jgi:hypothetical protein
MAINFNAPSQVRPYANLGAFPATGAVKTIYIAEDTNYIYRWNGTVYIEISVADLVGYVPYTGATQDVNLGAYDAYVNKLWLYDAVNDNYGSVHFTDTDFHIEDADGHKMLVIEDGFMQIHKTDTIQSNLFTSGLTATRDHYLPDASGTIALTSDLAGYVPTSRTLTINGVTQDLSADRTFTISTGITIGTTAITSGTVGRVLFEGTGNVVQESANLFWDNTNGRLGIGTSSPLQIGHFYNTAVADLYVQIQTTQSRTSGLYTQNLGAKWFTGTQYGAVNAYQIVDETNNRIQFTAFNDGNAQFATINSSLGVKLAVRGLGSTSSTKAFLVQNSSATDLFTIWNDGNIGVNTSVNSGYKVDINGTLRASVSTGGTGFTLTSTVSANPGNFSITANATAIGSFGDFTMSTPNGTRFFIGGNYATIFTSTNNVTINPALIVGGNLTVNGGGTSVISTNTLFLGATSNTSTSLFWTTGGSVEAKILWRLNNLGSYGRTDLFLCINNSATSTVATISDARVAFLSNGNVLVGSTTDISSSKFTIQSTTQGFLPPRMTTAQKNAIVSPVAGLQVYDTTLNLMSYYNGTMWI